MRSLHDTAWVLLLKSSTLSDWNRFFDEQLNVYQKVDKRGKVSKITTGLVKKVIEAARQVTDEGKRLRIKSFTRKLCDQEIVLSRKTVADILIANGLYKARLKDRRPRFYQSLQQNIPNGLVSVDGKEFTVVIDNEIHKFNLELSVDVQSFLHSAFSVSDTETTAEFIKVLESHISQWGKPLALVTDHGSANLSSRAQTYLRKNDIEILPAGPANPKGNGTVESAFSGMERVIGTIYLDTSSPRALAKGVLEKIISIYVNMRNKLSRRDSKYSPEQMMDAPVSAQQRQQQKSRFRKRAEKLQKPAATTKQDRLQWLIEHYAMQIDEKSRKRAVKCIEYYDLEAIGKTEEAFLRAVTRNDDKCNIAYFFGILKNIQTEMDTVKYEDYCRKRYNYLQMKDRQREEIETAQDQATVEVMLDTLLAAMACPLNQVRNIATNQAKSMMLDLKKQYRCVTALKKKVLDVINQIGDISLKQRDTVVGLVDQFLA